MSIRETDIPWEHWTEPAGECRGNDASETLYGQLILLAVFALAALMRLLM